jgi:WbqC-like protein family
MTKTVVILQSNYLPWRGYFDLLRRADLFVVLDVVQFTKNDWRNRNIIKTPSGPQWLTIPVRHSLGEATTIDRATVADTRWAAKHIKSLKQCYSRAAAYDETASWLFGLIERLAVETQLSVINVQLLAAIAAQFGIRTPIIQCTDLLHRDLIVGAEPSQRLVDLCRAAGATHYLSGPAAQSYLNTGLFSAHGIAVDWMSYAGYPPYPQLWGAFDPKVSIVDLLFNTGSEAATYIPSLQG